MEHTLTPPTRAGGGSALVGPMELTKRFLRAKNPCANGFRWFVRHIEDGVSYQQALDTLVQAGRVDDACWLLQQFGPTDEVLELDHLEADAIVFAGSLHIRQHIEVGTLLRTGQHLRVGGSVRVGQQLHVGGDVWSGGGVRCDGPLHTGGDLRADWSVEAAQAIHCGGELRVGGDLTGGASLHVQGQASIKHDVIMRQSITGQAGLRVGGLLHGGHSVQAGQGILVGQDIVCGMHLEAGWGIRAGGDISAHGAIRAGESLQAVGEIRAGQGYGVYAGLGVPIDAWGSSGHVVAARKPEVLLSGHWVGPEGNLGDGPDALAGLGTLG